MKQFFLSFLIAACVTVLFPGCHKSVATGTTTSNPCKLVSATSNNQGETINYSFSYDAKGRLISVKSSGGFGKPYTETLVYGDNYIAISTDYSGSPGVSDTVFLDASGNVSSIAILGSGSKSTITYTRDGQGNPTQSVTVSGNGTTTTSIYQYTNGDLTGSSTMGDAVSYGYYTDKPSAINDALAMQQFLTYGVIAYKSAHLCKSFQAATISQTYAYTMDDKGNISTMTTTDNKTGKTTGTTQFTYDCN